MDYEVILITPHGSFGIDDPSQGFAHSKRLDSDYYIVKNGNELVLATPDGAYKIGNNVSDTHILTDIVQMRFAGFYLVYFDVRPSSEPNPSANSTVAPLLLLGFL